MNKKIYKYLQYIFLLFIGISLLYLTLHKLQLKQVSNTIAIGNYWLVIPVLFISLVVYFFRVLRWSLLYNQINQDISKGNLTISLCLAYLVNFAIPRMGEITRCLVLKKLNQTPINLSLSTVIFERTIDIIALFIITITAIILEYFHHSSLLNSFTDFKIISTQQIVLLIIMIAIISILIIYIIFKTENKIKSWFSVLWIAIVQLAKIKNLFLFSLYTLCIWCCYYLMTYLWFFTFIESSSLSYYMAFQVMLVGTFARSIPLQAGSAGAYHYGVSQALIYLGVSSITANALAIIIHGFQTIFTFIIGIVAYIAFFIKSKDSLK